MEMLCRSASSVLKLILCFSALTGTSCTGGKVSYGDYHGAGQQKISITPDAAFAYAVPGLMGAPALLSGTWTQEGDRLLLHAQKSDTRKLVPVTTIAATEAPDAQLVVTPEIGENVTVEVVVDGAKVGDLTRNDSSFVFKGKLNQLVLRAYASGMYAELFQKDTLYADAIDFAGYKKQVHATVKLHVALRDFYKIPVEDSSLQIKKKDKLYWEKKNALFIWKDPVM